MIKISVTLLQDFSVLHVKIRDISDSRFSISKHNTAVVRILVLQYSSVDSSTDINSHL